MRYDTLPAPAEPEFIPYAKRIWTLRNTPVPMPGTCFECGKPMTDWLDACLIFIDPAFVRGQAAGEWLPRIGHVMCGAGPYVGAAIDLYDLLDETIDGPWVQYVRKQSWWREEFIGEVHVAFRVGRALRDWAIEDEVEPEPVPDPVAVMRPVAASIPRRRPRPSANPRSITVTMRARVFERDDFRCRRCGSGPDVAPLVIDHIVPVAKGGTGEFDNLQTLCHPCNAGKRDRDPHAHDRRNGG